MVSRTGRRRNGVVHGQYGSRRRRGEYCLWTTENAESAQKIGTDLSARSSHSLRSISTSCALLTARVRRARSTAIPLRSF